MVWRMSTEGPEVSAKGCINPVHSRGPTEKEYVCGRMSWTYVDAREEAKGPTTPLTCLKGRCWFIVEAFSHLVLLYYKRQIVEETFLTRSPWLLITKTLGRW